MTCVFIIIFCPFLIFSSLLVPLVLKLINYFCYHICFPCYPLSSLISFCVFCLIYFPVPIFERFPALFLYSLPCTAFVSPSLYLSITLENHILSCFLYVFLSFLFLLLSISYYPCVYGSRISHSRPHSDDRHPSRGKWRILLWWRITHEPTCSAEATSHKLLENI